MPFQVYETESFLQVYESLDSLDRQWINKIKIQLVENPFSGKPLGYKWFREKKLGDKRLYFMVSDEKQKVLLLAYGNKKKQRKIIDHILWHKSDYLEMLRNI